MPQRKEALDDPRSVLLTLRASRDEVRAAEALAVAWGCGRSEAFRRAVRESLARLERDGAPDDPGPMVPRGAADRVMAALSSLARKHDRMVPIGALRRAVLAGGGTSREAFDRLVLAMERAWEIDLKLADDPRRADASEGIAVPGRGLVFYALAPGAR